MHSLWEEGSKPKFITGVTPALRAWRLGFVIAKTSFWGNQSQSQGRLLKVGVMMYDK